MIYRDINTLDAVAYSRSSQYLASLSYLWIQVASSPPDMTAAYYSRQSAVPFGHL